MNNSEAVQSTTDASVAAQRPPVEKRRQQSPWWDVILWPIVGLTIASIVFFAIGWAQRAGWIADDQSLAKDAAAGDSAVRYICPMMCVAPTSAPGRCPVCDMELVEATTGPAYIDPATRRVLNIQTARVAERHVVRTIRSVGEIGYDESKLKTLSAYVDGRVEKLYANYTGIDVQHGDRLALVYSPRLYASQIELLLARRADNDQRLSAEGQAARGEHYRSARRRLIELGMTEDQIVELELAGEAHSRMHLVAPMSGTVIERLAAEGQYIKEGEPIYRLADLSTVWLVLRMFPEDAALVQLGQRVIAEVQSLPGRQFEGRVDFIFPDVDPVSRTVAVRVAMENAHRLLRVGDFSRAQVEVPVHATDDPAAPALVVPRDAVLMAGDHSVVYVETEPGRFELRRVAVGPVANREIVVLDGLRAGDVVATRGNFLIDSQMQLAGNPSLVDPSRAAAPTLDESMTDDVLAALALLSQDDRQLAIQQRLCVVAGMPLGSMGTPIKVDVTGQSVFICCEGCRKRLLADPQQYLNKLKQLIDTQRNQPALPNNLPDPHRGHQP